MSETGPTSQEPPPPPAPAMPRWRRGHSGLWMAVEVVLISASVFLGLAGQQWLEDRQHREEATDTLRRFRTEIVANKREIETKLPYHERLHKSLRPYVRADPQARATMSPGPIDDLQPPFFEQTAWELALGTQSLVYLEKDLAFVLSRIYSFQRMTNSLGEKVMTVMYSQTPESEAFLRALDLYYGDLVGLEPGILAMYDVALKAIDETLTE